MQKIQVFFTPTKQVGVSTAKRVGCGVSLIQTQLMMWLTRVAEVRWWNVFSNRCSREFWLQTFGGVQRSRLRRKTKRSCPFAPRLEVRKKKI
jgi:hypothetical protein